MSKPVPDWCAGWDPKRTLFVSLPFIFVYYSGLLLHGSEGYKAPLSAILIRELLIFELIS